MTPVKTIDTFIFFSMKAFLWVVLSSMAGTFLSIMLVIKFEFPQIVGWIGFFIFFICPIIFNTQIRKIFTRRAIVRFNDNSFSIEILNFKNGDFEKRNEYLFKEIAFYKALRSGKVDSSVLKLSFINKRKQEVYTFLKQEENNNIINTFYAFIKSYNDLQCEDLKITIRPSLFASRMGTYFIILITVVQFLAILLQIIYNPKAIPFSLIIGIAIYIQIYNQRKNDIEEYNKMK